MLDFPTPFVGVLTLGLLFGLGLFVVPYLLKQRGGVPVIGAITVLLLFVFYAIERDRDVPILASAAIAALWALAPVIVGVIVRRANRTRDARRSADEPRRAPGRLV